MKIGARNRIIGKITDVKKGTLMCLVKVEIVVKAVNVLLMK